MTQPTFSSIIKEAIKMEEESYALYTEAQKRTDLESSKAFLKELAETEMQHKEKLIAILEDTSNISKLGIKTKKMEDLKIADFLEDVQLNDSSNYQEILIFAAKKEKKSYEYYTSLSDRFKGTNAGELFANLAKEEIEHKSKLEKEYDEQVLKED